MHDRLCGRFLRNRVAQRFTEISDGWVSESKVWSLTEVFFVLNLDTAVDFTAVWSRGIGVGEKG